MTIIFKLGGSLLTLPDLASRLKDVLKLRIGENCLVVPGGGATADLVRGWSKTYKLDEERSHWLAIASLDLNGRLLKQLMNWQSASSKDEACSLWNNRTSPLILEMEKFVSAAESQSQLHPGAQRSLPNADSDRIKILPHHWDTTSDSLAAWTAIDWSATELVMIKSVSTPIGLSAKQASEKELVDPLFPSLSQYIPRISWCNLRATTLVIEPWLEFQA